MPSFILPQIWTRQPPACTPIDWSNPLTKGLLSVTLPGANGILVTTPSQKLFRSSSSIDGLKTSPGVGGLYRGGATGNSFDYVISNRPITNSLSTPTIFTLFECDTYSGDSGHSIYGQFDAFPSASNGLWVGYSSGSTLNIGFRLAGASRGATLGSKVNGKIHSAFGWWDSVADTGYAELDGGTINASSTSTAVFSGTVDKIASGLNFNTASSGSYKLYLGATWDRILSSSERDSIRSNPYSLII